ncbi:hypothetical protein PoB_005945400 [Plakobranchus ocellatus]|uniref:Uncharacterized protein n=1 Tax=Plakobranchus ocellatus TaxID=259542 RepID=A0AAV4CN23_9GAST|nr:hypothetical protein PoB_005945400 [Plakobranchus ocellatus]
MSSSSLLILDCEDYACWPLVVFSLPVTSCIDEFISAQAGSDRSHWVRCVTHTPATEIFPLLSLAGSVSSDTIDGRAMSKVLEASKAFNTESTRKCPLTALAAAFHESMCTTASGAYITSRSSCSPDPVIR